MMHVIDPPRRPSSLPEEPDDAFRALRDTVQEHSAWIKPVRQEMARVIVGQKHLVDRLLIALLTNGHVLLEGVPGLAKTLSLKTLASAVALRIQAPAVHARHAARRHRRHHDLQSPGRGISHQARPDIQQPHPGGRDQSRARPRCRARCSRRCRSTRSRSARRPIRCPNPFLVLATQNPLEQEGTYPLPEAQIDRFMMKVIVELSESRRGARDPGCDGDDGTDARAVRRMVSAEQILEARHVVNAIYIDDKIRDYIVDLVLATRPPGASAFNLNGYIQNGASPRATINLCLAARAVAFLSGRHFVTPQDVKTIALDVLRHRVIGELRGGGREHHVRGCDPQDPRPRCPCRRSAQRMPANSVKTIMSRMRQLEIRTRRLVNDSLAGEYHSVFKGRGMDFDEVREYVPGDEVRTIDWNVTARAGRPFVKKFTEERELNHVAGGGHQRVRQFRLRRPEQARAGGARWPACWRFPPSATATRWG